MNKEIKKIKFYHKKFNYYFFFVFVFVVFLSVEVNDSLKFFVEFLASWCWFLSFEFDSENGSWFDALRGEWFIDGHLATLGKKFLKPGVEVVDIDWWDIGDYLRFGCEGWDFIS